MAVAKQKPTTTGWSLAANSRLFNFQGNEASSYNYDVKPQAECDSPTSILLIGLTGNGKSSLGNFLLDPSDEHIQRKKTFQTGTTNKLETKKVKYEYNRKRNPSLLVIDTPGLNEGIKEDRLHMDQVVQTLKELKSITACAFCIKFDSTIDAQYKATITYYKKQLPKLFERNVVIVLTNFLTNKRSERMRQLQGVNADAIMCNTKHEVVKSAELSYTPQVFVIDSLPMSEDERRTSEWCRSSLLDYIKQSLKPISVKDLRTAEREVLNTHVDSGNEASSYNYDVKPQAECDPPISILLIGSTGNGKSSLGNFLLDPSDEHIWRKKTFQTGTTNKPATEEVKCAYSQKGSPSLLVIDTPGLNEGVEEDRLHMDQILQVLKELRSIPACVFCINFDSTIDAQYKATIAYYKKKLPKLFKRNVVIVLTNFKTDERSVKLRQIRGVNVDAIVCNTKHEVVKSAELSYTPQVFKIDSLPMSEEEQKKSKRRRSSLLNHIKQSLQPISVKDLRTAERAAPQRLSILLIGSTGNGKSSLGNFLLDPSDEHILGKNTIFRTARSNLPETQYVQDNQCAYDWDVSLQVIDTPGLNKSDVKDLSHMIDLVKTLKHLESIAACLFCIKFDSKIDDQYKYTAAYYRRLLPSLFEGNVIIVLTNFPTDQRSVRMRDIQGVDVNAIICNAQKEIVDGANLAFVPPVFLIDSLPMSEEERTTSLSCRSSMVDYIRQSLRRIRIKELYVAKTRALKERDNKEIKQLDGEIHGYNMRLKEVNKKAERILDEIEQAQKEATEVRREIRNIEAELHEKDSEKTVIVKTWNLGTSWKWFQWQTKSFDIRAEYPIVDVTRWDNGHLTWREFQWSKDPGRAYGKVEGELSRGLYATVTLLTEKRMMYKKAIESCRKKLAEKKEEHARVKEFINRRGRSIQEEHRQEIELLKTYIEKRNKRKDNISADFMSIEEACKRVAELSTIQ